jgi:hypothetical protein
VEAKYVEWVEQRVEADYQGEAWRMMGQCRQEAEKMGEAFPELRVVKGHVTVWREILQPQRTAHWWCVAVEGEIVDPTRGQYPWPVTDYEQYVEGDPVRLGKCANCGDEIWGDPAVSHPTVCSDECYREFAAYLDGGG